MLQFLEMEGERGRRQPELVADLAGGETPLPRLNEQPVNIEAGFLSQRRQGREDF